jgi:hypothetical protein
VQPDRRARWVLPLAVVALLVWPLSYAWIPNAGRNPAWVLTLVPVAEIGAMLLAVIAIRLGTMAARADGSTPSSERGTRLGIVVVFLVIGGNLLGKALSG